LKTAIFEDVAPRRAERHTECAYYIGSFNRKSIPMIRTPIVALFSLAVLLVPRSLYAQTPKLAVSTAKPPAEVAEPIRAALDGKVLRIEAESKPIFEFWFRNELPLAEKPAGGTLGLTTMPEGAVLGVVRVGEDQYDFRNEEIPKGVYVLRLGIQPEDGNHLGVAPTRTFAMLLPAKQDTKLEPVQHEELMKAAAKINAAKHPSNLNIQPVEKMDGQFPRLEERNGGEHKVILLKIPGRVGKSADKATLTFALVYDGQGQL
jgi:hypothetical protein